MKHQLSLFRVQGIPKSWEVTACLIGGGIGTNNFTGLMMTLDETCSKMCQGAEVAVGPVMSRPTC